MYDRGMEIRAGRYGEDLDLVFKGGNMDRIISLSETEADQLMLMLAQRKRVARQGDRVYVMTMNEAELIIDLVDDYRNDLASGEVTGSDWTTDEVASLGNDLDSQRQRHESK